MPELDRSQLLEDQKKLNSVNKKLIFVMNGEEYVALRTSLNMMIRVYSEAILKDENDERILIAATKVNNLIRGVWNATQELKL